MRYNLIITISVDSKEINVSSEVIQINTSKLISDAIAKGANVFVKKTGLIEEFLMQNNSDVVLGNAAVNRSEYNELKKVLPVGRYQITTAYYRKSDKYLEYAKLYADHARWLDYPPEYVKEQEEKFNQELDELIKVLRSENIEVIQVGA